MKTIRFLVFRVFLLIAFITTYVYFFYGQERGDAVPIARNVAWNDLVHQVDPSANDSSRETLSKGFGLIQKFLRERQSEVKVGIYDITVFRAIDQARARLQKAAKDLETINNELAYKEVQAKLGSDPWNRKQSSIAANADSPLSLVKTLSASRFLATKLPVSFTADFRSEAAGKGTLSRASNRVSRVILWEF